MVFKHPPDLLWSDACTRQLWNLRLAEETNRVGV
jgi:hypothetical protein